MFPVVYEKATGAVGRSQPGAEALMAWALKVSSGTNLGIYNPRLIRGSKTRWSIHAEGRAVDVGFPTLPQGHPDGHRLAGLLVKHHASLGVQQVIWARQVWRNTIGEWRPYRGTSPHLDHVHAELTRAAAAGLTAEMIAVATAPPPQGRPAMPATIDLAGIVAYIDLCYEAAGRPAGNDPTGRRYWAEGAAKAVDPWPILDQMWGMLNAPPRK